MVKLLLATGPNLELNTKSYFLARPVRIRDDRNEGVLLLVGKPLNLSTTWLFQSPISIGLLTYPSPNQISFIFGSKPTIHASLVVKIQSYNLRHQVHGPDYGLCLQILCHCISFVFFRMTKLCQSHYQMLVFEIEYKCQVVMVEIKYIDVLVMILKIRTVKKPKKIVVINFLV